MKKKAILNRLPKFKFVVKASPKSKKYLLAILAIVFASVLIYRFKSLLVAAVVDGKPITRLSIDRLLEKQGGQQVLENEIINILIENEAKKQNIVADQEKIDAQFKEYENQATAAGYTLDDWLSSQGQTRDGLKKYLGLKLALESILSKDISVSDEDINKYYKDNQAMLYKDKKLEDVREEIAQDLKLSKMSEKIQPWLEELKQKAKIYYFLKF